MTDKRAFLARVAAAAVDEGSADVVYATVATPIGRLLVAQTPSGICRVAFAEEPEDAVLHELAARVSPRVVASAVTVAPALEALAAYLEGEAVSLDLPVDLSLVRSPFGLKVLGALREVPRGEVTTYGRLAGVIGHPRASRATGTALGRNPVPIVVPCHRVVPGSGGVGKYGGRAWRKQKLLELEGAL